MPLRFLFYLGHPAHFHNLKHSIEQLRLQGHEIKVVARGKDVLFELLESMPWDVVKLPERSGRSKLALIKSIASREGLMLKLALAFKPNLMAGTDLVITHVGKVLGIPSLVINEDDSAAIPLMAKYAFPYATAILAPHCCDQSPANHKKIGYHGYHELAYLHPNRFQTNRSHLPTQLQGADKYFLLRFASLNAHHDSGRRGISDELALKIIEKLGAKGSIFITSERTLSASLEPYRIPIHPRDMHHAMAHAAMYIGDSQTMAAEAAVLGVPSIRFNDFVGQLSYLEELEHRFGLTTGISASDPERLMRTIDLWLSDGGLLQAHQNLRSDMLKVQIDVTPFWVETFLSLAGKSR